MITELWRAISDNSYVTYFYLRDHTLLVRYGKSDTRRVITSMSEDQLKSWLTNNNYRIVKIYQPSTLSP